MTVNGMIQIAVFLLLLLLLAKPIGWYISKVYDGKPHGLNKPLGRFEHWLYRVCRINPNQGMNWRTYLVAMLVFNFFSLIIVYFVQRIQQYLPLNPQHFTSRIPHAAFNTAISFVTNTDWQSYSGETTMSYLTQMLVLTVQNFLSAASGMALLIALIRGIRAQENENLGNYWVDVVRGILYILLPFSFILALILASQGVIQNFKPSVKVNLIQPVVYQVALQSKVVDALKGMLSSPQEIVTLREQIIPMGPVASQVAIKQLGTNGGGFFNVNSAHPFENPTPVSNFFEMLALIFIPVALCITFGIMVSDIRQGWATLAAMFLIFIPFMLLAVNSEQRGNPAFEALGVMQTPVASLFQGGNMEGKETRIGIVNSALWATATTSGSNGSVNAMFDSFTPIGGLVPLWMMHLGEIVFGGAGSGLYGMLLFVIITVFVTGLLVGRTPEYLGKKIEPYEMKMASFGVLVMPLTVLVFTAIAVVSPMGVKAVHNPGMHGFSEILYAFTSMGNNNGSSFAGLSTNTPFYNILGGVAMLLCRYWIAIPMLAIAGSLAKKKVIPISEGTLATHTPLFVILLASITIILGALSFLPAFALGAIAEQLMLS